jgi:hypothetical protein
MHISNLRSPARTRFNQNEEQEMKSQISKRLRITLLVYAVYWAIFGLLHVFFPVLVQAKDPAVERVLGAAYIGFALGAWLAYMEKAWDRAKIMILTQIAWLILYVITMAWGILAGGMSADTWIPTIIGAVFGVMLAIFYIREERIKR